MIEMIVLLRNASAVKHLGYFFEVMQFSYILPFPPPHGVGQVVYLHAN